MLTILFIIIFYPLSYIHVATINSVDAIFLIDISEMLQVYCAGTTNFHLEILLPLV